MLELLSLLKFVLIQTFGLTIAFVAGGIFVFLVLRKLFSLKKAILLFLAFFGIFLFVYSPKALPNEFEYPFFLETYGPAAGPGIPLKNIFAFFRNAGNTERIVNIAHNPNNVPEALQRDIVETVKIHIEAKEVIAEMAPGVFFNYWTFDGQVPGPFLRVRQGDTVELTLSNHPSSIHHHSIDLHAVTGPGGGASVTNVAPGESKTFTFKALNPGLFVYHCAHPNVATHMAHGMYGMILVEPEEGLPEVDKEFYVMQGEFYSAGGLGDKGLQIFDAQKMLDGHAEYVVFNGKVGGTIGNMEAAVGDRVRIYFGNGGVNMISSFHVIGEILDTVYLEAAMGSPVFKNVQTTTVPAGGATIAEFDLEVPGTYVLVDHALARLDRGAWGTLKVTGPENPEIFYGDNNHDNSHE